jgi:predicted dithiol-disulfide oxidoreductase (DUF899 family)
MQFPNESKAYRAARNDLLKAEINLRQQIEKVAALRRSLPAGGEVAEDYVFVRTEDAKGLPDVHSDARRPERQRAAHRPAH